MLVATGILALRPSIRTAPEGAHQREPSVSGVTETAIEISAGAPLRARSRSLARAREAIAREALLVASLASFCVAFVSRVTDQVNQDAWLGLVAGREVDAHGIPRHDTLTVWAHGTQWIDQQWLGQLALFRADALGGLAGVALLHVVLTGGAYALAVVAARRLGGTTRAVLWLLPACLWLFVFGTWQVRTQTFSYVPFVAVLWLLVRDARRPDRRVFLVLPLLALWANVHGAVTLAAGLVVVRGVFALAERRRASVLRGAALVVLAPLMLVVSPYGPALAGYYRSTLLNGGFGVLVSEWQPTSFGLATFAFFGLAAFAAMRVASRPGVLGRFELAALLLTALAALKAERNVVWFVFAALVLLPRLSAARPDGPRPSRQVALDLGLAGLAGATALAALGWLAARPDSAFEGGYPARAGALVAQAAGAAPTARVYADVHYADWLLWRHPELAGRIVFDARFELLSPERLVSIPDFQEPTDSQPRRVLRRDGILVLDPAYDGFALRSLRGDPLAVTRYRDGAIAVVVHR
jgi:hypothetical protein